MSKSRRKFDRNFKLKAVELSYQRANIKELADTVGGGPGAEPTLFLDTMI